MRLGLCIVVVMVTASCPLAFGLEQSTEDKIYRCDRPTPLFTNKASYGCQEYRPQGLIAVSPNAIMFFGNRGNVQSGPSVETAAHRPGDSGQDRLCRLYDEWVSLNERTAGGLRYDRTDQAVRWQTLSKIFSAIGVPEKECSR
jgi:hypothetical protein